MMRRTSLQPNRYPWAMPRQERRFFSHLTLGVVLVFLLSACAGSPAAEPSRTPTADAATTPTPTATPAPYEWSLDCKELDENRATVSEGRFASLSAAWADGRPWARCEAYIVSGDTYSDIERAAVATAGYEDISSVDTLYGLCGEVAGFYVVNGPVSESQAQEIAGMLTLCPEFPSAQALLAASAAAQQVAAERAAGVRIGGGVFEVGVTIQPGKYQTTGPVQNCYWERLDAAGEIIDNNFVSAATQVQVTVAPTDFSLHASGCGEMVRIG